MHVRLTILALTIIAKFCNGTNAANDPYQTIVVVFTSRAGPASPSASLTISGFFPSFCIFIILLLCFITSESGGEIQKFKRTLVRSLNMHSN